MEECFMRHGRTPLAIPAAVAVAIAFGMWNGYAQAKPPAADAANTTPAFQVDPYWPKPLPDNWVTGEIGGTCVDSQDHVFVVTRGFQNGGLASPEGKGGADPRTGQFAPSKASPPVIEFAPDGSVANSWGDASLVPAGQPHALQNAVLPNGIHGCFVDYQDNVWIAGNGDGVVQKWSHDGSAMLLQIGTKFTCDDGQGGSIPCVNPGSTGGADNVFGNVMRTGSSHTLLNLPADIAVDPNPDPVTGQRGSVYIADGYGNHRVVVFDSTGHYLRQFGSIGTGPGQFTAGDGGHPHCVVIGKDAYVYACDRGQDRVNVFTKTGDFVKAIPIIPGTAALGTAGSAWDIDFSADAMQKFAYVSDGGNEVMWIFNHADALNGSAYVPPVGGFGRPGHMAGDFTFLHMMAIDSKGNLYAGETVGGRRIQKFTKMTASCPGNSQGQGNAGPGGCPGNSGGH
jgi:hypothetical protein